MTITIDPTKNIGIIFQLRSGSTALQQYLASRFHMANIMELFNAYTNNNFLTGPASGKNTLPPPAKPTAPSLTPWPATTRIEALLHLDERVTALQAFNAQGKLGVFKVNVMSYMKDYPTFSDVLASQTNIQFINLERADVLYSLISRFLSVQTGDWNIFGNTPRPINAPAGTTYAFSAAQVRLAFDEYLAKRDHIAAHFPTVPTIYYEEFQNNPANLSNMIAGGDINSQGRIAVSKFTDNHKLLISNLAEVEAIYQEYVRLHPTYFPASTGKVPGVAIPVAQGNQPT